MTNEIQLKMSEWTNKGDDVSMFKFASMLFITAPNGKEKELQDILNHTEYLANSINDIELARAKKEIQQLLEG
jgi:hypothetical protein